MRAALAADAALTSVWNEVDGVQIHGRISSSRVAGPPVIFVHGLGVSTRYMEPTMRLLARTHQVAGLDLPGFGRSGSPPRTLTLGELATALLCWLDAREIGPAVFVGNSFGCQVIVEAITREPARAVGLVLNAPTMDRAHRSAMGQILRVITDIPHESLALAWIVTRDYLRAGPFRILATLRMALADRIEDKLPNIVVPVTVLCGALDPVVRVAWASELAGLVGRDHPGSAGAALHVVPDGSHALPFDEPDEVAAHIVALVSRTSARSPA